MPTPDFDAWFSVRVVRDPEQLVTSGQLWDDYRSWLAHHRPTDLPISFSTFMQLVGKRGVERTTLVDHGQVMRKGIRLAAWAPHEDAPLGAANADEPEPVLGILRRINAGVAERGAVMIAAGDPLAAEIAQLVEQGAHP